MSKDLSILVPNLSPFGVNHLRLMKLEFHRKDYDKYDLLKKKATSLSNEQEQGLKLYLDKEPSGTPIDPYGDPYTTIEITDFIEIYQADDLNNWDQAILAFLKTLPKDLDIILYYD